MSELMTEQLDLFSQDHCCWRYFNKKKCWDCPIFALGEVENECMKHACGTCADCETPKGKYFVGCEYAEGTYKP